LLLLLVLLYIEKGFPFLVLCYSATFQSIKTSNQSIFSSSSAYLCLLFQINFNGLLFYSFPFLSGCILFFVRLFSLGTVLSIIGHWAVQSARKQTKIKTVLWFFLSVIILQNCIYVTLTVYLVVFNVLWLPFLRQNTVRVSQALPVTGLNDRAVRHQQ
jgi:hypothetical protein